MIYVCGFPRSGTSMFYLMLRATVTKYQFFDQEMPADAATGNTITKRPLDMYRNYRGKRAIILVRDPRSVLTSKHWSNPDEYFVSADKCLRHKGLLAMWDAVKRKPGYRLHYEDVVADPDQIQYELGQEFGFEYSGWFSDFHKADIPMKLERPLNGIRPVDNGHDWREHMPRIEDQFKRFPQLFDVLLEMGYEKDRS